MAQTTLKTRIALRRDLEANYSASFVPLKGELCLVDTASGLRAKYGDGVTTFGNLSYSDEAIYEEIDRVVMRGYYLNGKFYVDSTYQTELPKYHETIYIDRNSQVIYTYAESNKFVSINDTLPKATEEVAGIMKLYQTSGQNTDGSMSQKTITDGVNSIKFAVDTIDTECLVLDLPWD